MPAPSGRGVPAPKPWRRAAPPRFSARAAARAPGRRDEQRCGHRLMPAPSRRPRRGSRNTADARRGHGSSLALRFRRVALNHALACRAITYAGKATNDLYRSDVVPPPVWYRVFAARFQCSPASLPHRPSTSESQLFFHSDGYVNCFQKCEALHTRSAMAALASLVEAQMRWIEFALIAGLVLAAAGAGILVASTPHETHETPTGGGGGASFLPAVY